MLLLADSIQHAGKLAARPVHQKLLRQGLLMEGRQLPDSNSQQCLVCLPLAGCRECK